MIRLDEVAARLAAKVPDLAGRIEFAGQFSVVIESGSLPDNTPAAYVLPGGLRGGQADAAVNLFRQGFVETVLVVLVIRVAGDALGQAGLDEATPICRQIIEGIVGWVPQGPPAALGTMQLASMELVGSMKGALLFQFDFALNDQLRITPS